MRFWCCDGKKVGRREVLDGGRGWRPVPGAAGENHSPIPDERERTVRWGRGRTGERGDV